MLERIKNGHIAIFFGIIIGILFIFSFLYFGYPGGDTFTIMMIIFIIFELVIAALAIVLSIFSKSAFGMADLNMYISFTWAPIACVIMTIVYAVFKIKIK